jgi:thioredoxin reductase (NADPH)
MQTRAFDNPRIEFAWNTTVDDILGGDKVTGMRLRDTVTGDLRELPVTGVFIAIGHRPNTDLFIGQLPMDDDGYLVTHPDRSTTDIAGVFACGDVQDHTYRQAVTAAGSGCMAAIDAERWLQSRHD